MLIKSLLTALVLALSGSVLFVLATRQPAAPTIATVQLDYLLADHMQRFGAQASSPEQRQAMASQYADAMRAALLSVEQREHVVLLTAPAVLSEVRDLTEDVRAEVLKRMEANEPAQ